MRILALDVATSTGWALGAPGRPARHGIYTIQSRGERLGAYLSDYSFWLARKIVEGEPDRLVFEAPIITADTSLMMARKLYGLAGLTEMVALVNGMSPDQIFEIESSAWRASFLGSHYPVRRRGMPKGTMRRLFKAAAATVCKLHGYTPVGEDDADALGIWTHAQGIAAISAKISKGSLL